MIKDSGDRTTFSTGAVRDIHEEKGRCDLMPLREMALSLRNGTLNFLSQFKSVGVEALYNSLVSFAYAYPVGNRYDGAEESERLAAMFLDVSVHFKEGAEKYGEDNWQKGIPIHCYIDSAVRHLLKFIAGWSDEPHHRAFVWNILCAIWTMENKPEMDDYTEGRGNDGKQ